MEERVFEEQSSGCRTKQASSYQHKPARSRVPFSVSFFNKRWIEMQARKRGSRSSLFCWKGSWFRKWVLCGRSFGWAIWKQQWKSKRGTILLGSWEIRYVCSSECSLDRWLSSARLGRWVMKARSLNNCINLIKNINRYFFYNMLNT